MTQESPFREAALGGPGGWSDEQLAQIPEIKTKICELLRDGLFLSEICQEIGVTPNTVRKWRHSDKEFDELYTDAEAAVTDTLEKEALRRARNGVLEPVVSAGKVVMHNGEPLMVRRYSDSLMQFLLRGRRAEVYGDKREVNAKVGIDVLGSKAALEQKFAAVATVVDAADGSAAGTNDSSAS